MANRRIAALSFIPICAGFAGMEIYMKSIFISSTFKDMQKERDIINLEIVPRLLHDAAKVKCSIHVTDLRWGIDTSFMDEKETGLKVLSVCFNEIKKCSFIIALLGDRYGSIPDKKIMQAIIEENNIGFDWKDKSVTHMEIEQSIANNLPDNNGFFIYIRNMDYTNMPAFEKEMYVEKDDYLKTKIKDLKAYLREHFPDSIKTYNAKWDPLKSSIEITNFADMVYQDLNKALFNHYEKINYLSSCHEQFTENEFFVSYNTTNVYIPHEIMNAHKASVLSHKSPLYHFTGEAGCGKSTYLCNLYNEIKQSHHKIGFIPCGSNFFTSTTRGIAEFFLCSIMIDNGEEYDYENNQNLAYAQIIEKLLIIREKLRDRYIFILDSIDCVADVPSIVNFINWINNFMRNYITLVVASIDDTIFRIKPSIETITDVISYDSKDCLCILECQLDMEKKELNDYLKKLILNKNGASNPLWISLMVRRLLMMNSYDFRIIYNKGDTIDTVNDYIYEIIKSSPAAASELAGNIMVEAASRINKQLITLIINYLCASRNGLRESDLETVAERNGLCWNVLDFSYLIKYLKYFFIWHDNGIIHFSHNDIRKGINDAMPFDAEMVSHSLAVHFENIMKYDDFASHEFIWHCFKGKYNNGFAEYIISIFDKRDMDINTRKQCGQLLKDVCMMDEGRTWIIGCISICEDLEEVLKYTATITSAFSNCVFDHPDEAKNAVSVMMSFVGENLPEISNSAVLHTCSRIMRDFGLKDEAEHIFALLNNVQNREQNLAEISDLQSLNDATMKAQQLMDSRLFDEAYTICKSIEVYMESQDYSDVLNKIVLADVTTKLGLILKEKGKWEEAITYDEKSLAIYESLKGAEGMEEIVDRKIRARIYNLGNVYEAWAMEENYSPLLLEKTIFYYQQSYILDVVSMGNRMRYSEYEKAISLIFSYGTVLIRLGKIEEGLSKYREAKELIIDMVNKFGLHSTYINLVKHCLESSYQLAEIKMYEEACNVMDDIDIYMEIIEKNNPNGIIEILDFINHYSGHMNKYMSDFFIQKDINNAILCTQIHLKIFMKIISYLDARGYHTVFTNYKNLGDMLYLHYEDYEKAFITYIELLEIVDTYNFIENMDPIIDINNICNAIGMVCIRVMNCLIRLNRKEEAVNMAFIISNRMEYIISLIADFKSNQVYPLMTMVEKIDKTYPEVLLPFMQSAIILIDTIMDENTKDEMKYTVLAMLANALGNSGGINPY